MHRYFVTMHGKMTFFWVGLKDKNRPSSHLIYLVGIIHILN